MSYLIRLPDPPYEKVEVKGRRVDIKAAPDHEFFTRYCETTKCWYVVEVSSYSFLGKSMLSRKEAIEITEDLISEAIAVRGKDAFTNAIQRTIDKYSLFDKPSLPAAKTAAGLYEKQMKAKDA